MDLSVRALAEEQMDAEDLPADVYTQVLHDLARVNAITMASHPTLAFLKRANPVAPFRLLDVGYGDGDMLRAMWTWAQRRGLACTLVGIDLNPRSELAARERHPSGSMIEYRTGDYRDLANEPWDFIVSSLVTHHMNDAQRIEFLSFMEAHARKGWFVNDLHRHAFAYFGFPLLARLMGVHRIVREDGRLSIARSFRSAEWRTMLSEASITQARIERAFPFRLCVSRFR